MDLDAIAIGPPHVPDVSRLRGWRTVPVWQVDRDGELRETGDHLEVDGVDVTKSPGVPKCPGRRSAAGRALVGRGVRMIVVREP